MILRLTFIKNKNSYLWAAFTLYLLFTVCINAQTTGKLSGKVIDQNGEPLYGANVLIEGTNFGAATDAEGYYAVLNLRAGTYTVRFGFIGYQSKIVQNVKISGDQTTQLNVELAEETIVGEEVTVVAQRPIVETNQTSSISTVSSEDMDRLPVQGLSEIVNLQAGVVDGHFRGGRTGEVQYQVDGVSVNNPYDNSSTLQLDRSVLEEVQVISGTFDAKYGQAMSGVVNAILKSGSNKFEYSGEVYAGDYLPLDDNRYPYNEDYKPQAIQSYQLTLSGPTYIPNTTFLISGRRYLNDGYLFGYRRFNPTDSSNFETQQYNPTGDNEKIPMKTYEEWSGQFKITNQSIKGVILSYQATLNNIERKNYNHAFRFNPDGIKTNTQIAISHGLQMTHTLSEKFFYKLDVRHNYFDYKDYKYEDLFDPRYLEAGTPQGDPNYELGAYTQGVDLGRFIQKTNSIIGKLDFTWQANRINMIEMGIEAQVSKMNFGSPGYIATTVVNGVSVLLPLLNQPDLPGVRGYWPRQIAAYLQDRVEWGDLVVRGGIRFEYFDAQAKVPSNYQNPANSIEGAPLSVLKKTSIKTAAAPRLGFSFPLTDATSLYFSYGHFYQLPGLGQLYNNADYSILDDLQAGGITYGIMGNPDLKPEKTVQYELGLKQAVNQNLGLELTFFYKDIRDLLGVEFVSTYTAAEYPRYTNVDFGSVSGITFAVDQRNLGPITASLDYTLQFAQGNASDPSETASRAEAGKDPRPQDTPFSWDQRHTINASIIYYAPDNLSVSGIIRFSSGQPYTPERGSGFNADLPNNSGRKESAVTMDLVAEKYFSLSPVGLSLFLRVNNLFNTYFFNGFVFPTTGSPDYTLFPSQNRVQLGNPDRFREPRRIEFGISFRSL
jgi:outer membrane receptor protein involved in Fe transport